MSDERLIEQQPEDDHQDDCDETEDSETSDEEAAAINSIQIPKPNSILKVPMLRNKDLFNRALGCCQFGIYRLSSPEDLATIYRVGKSYTNHFIIHSSNAQSSHQSVYGTLLHYKGYVPDGDDLIIEAHAIAIFKLVTTGESATGVSWAIVEIQENPKSYIQSMCLNRFVFNKFIHPSPIVTDANLKIRKRSSSCHQEERRLREINSWSKTIGKMVSATTPRPAWMYTLAQEKVSDSLRPQLDSTYEEKGPVYKSVINCLHRYKSAFIRKIPALVHLAEIDE